jgi:transcription initiation factor IIE alpha subunit
MIKTIIEDVDKTEHTDPNCKPRTQSWYDFMGGNKCPVCNAEVKVITKETKIETPEIGFRRMKSEIDRAIS